MLDIALTEKEHDIMIHNSDMVLIGGAARVRQQAKIKLLLWKTEWFLDIDFGTPWEEVLGTKSSMAAVSAAIKTSLKNIDGLRSVIINSIKLDTAERKIFADIELNTSYGIERIELWL